MTSIKLGNSSPLLPVIFIGDSHVIRFGDYHSTIEAGEYSIGVVCETIYLPGFCLSDEKKINTLLLALAGRGHLEKCQYTGVVSHTSSFYNKKLLDIRRARGRPTLPPPIVVSAGDIDLRSFLMKEVVSQGSAQPNFEKVLGGIKQIFTVLRKCGFKKLLFMGLPPQCGDDDLFLKINGYSLPLKVRSSIARKFNELARSACEQLGVAFIDSYSHFGGDLGLNPEVSPDHIHLSQSTNGHFLLAAGLNYLNPKKIEAAWAILGHGREILQDVMKVETNFPFKKFLSMVAFSESLNNQHFRYDWAGNPIGGGNPNMQAAVLDHKLLEMVAELVFSNDIKDKIAPFFNNGRYTVICCRAFLSAPHEDDGVGPQRFHTDHHPDNCLRGILYLSDVDEGNGPFEWIGGDGKVTMECGQAGTLLIFNANLVTHRAAPPRRGIRKVIDLVLAPYIPGLGESVIFPGMNHWPVSPLDFSVNGFYCSDPGRLGRYAHVVSRL